MHILLLEDELCLMVLLCKMLRRHGYEVWEATNTGDAISRYLEAKGRIDLFLSDVTVPEITGIQAALLLRTESPNLNVILTSGYPLMSWNVRDTADFQRLGWDSVRVLQKPFEFHTLLNAIHELTEERPLAAGAV